MGKEIADRLGTIYTAIKLIGRNICVGRGRAIIVKCEIMRVQIIKESEIYGTAALVRGWTSIIPEAISHNSKAIIRVIDFKDSIAFRIDVDFSIITITIQFKFWMATRF